MSRRLLIRRALSAVTICAAMATGCSDDDAGVTAGSDTGATADVTGDAAGDVGADSGPADAIDTEDDPEPDLRAYSEGACPTITAGLNEMHSGTAQRQFEVFLPSDADGAPLIFFWYGAGGHTQTYEWMQDFATAYEVAIVVPHAMPNTVFEWPIMATNRPDAEVTFFDDMIACTTESIPVNRSRIYTSGFSAGALWSSYLVMERSDILASAVIYSGGTGSLVRSYETPETDIPILGFHGGDTDTYAGLVNFKEQMTEFMNSLVADGHLVFGCDHGAGHTIPVGAFDWGIRFLLAHAYGDTTSPFDDHVPEFLPDYCARW